MIRVVLFVVAAAVASVPVAAHPGGLNKEGCHNNRSTGDYHCHGGSGTSKASSGSSYSRGKSRKKRR